MNTYNYKPVMRIESDSLCYGIDRGLYALMLPENKIPSNVTFVSANDVPVLINEGILPMGASVGMTFLQSPYGDMQYVDLEKYEQKTMEQKMHHIMFIAVLLGAKYCEQKVLIDFWGKRTLDFSNNTKLKNSTIDATYKRDEENRLKSDFFSEGSYDGKFPTMDDYEQALEYAQKHNLLNDNTVQKLLKFRNPNGQSNFLKEDRLQVKLSEELNQVMDCAAELCVMDRIIDIDSKFISAVSIKKEVFLDLHLQFATPECMVKR